MGNNYFGTIKKVKPKICWADKYFSKMKQVPGPLAKNEDGKLVVPSVFLNQDFTNKGLYKDRSGDYWLQEKGWTRLVSGDQKVMWDCDKVALDIPDELKHKDGTIKSGLKDDDYCKIMYAETRTVQR